MQGGEINPLISPEASWENLGEPGAGAGELLSEKDQFTSLTSRVS